MGVLYMLADVVVPLEILCEVGLGRRLLRERVSSLDDGTAQRRMALDNRNAGGLCSSARPGEGAHFLRNSRERVRAV